jgi:uncharacterized tellurite resistance protein B-like protein
VALLIHVANVDGQTDLAERRRLMTIIEERFGLDAKAASELIAIGEQSDREAVDFYHFTSCLIPDFDGAFLSQESRDALWHKFYTAAPQRQRRSVEQYKIVKRA